MSVNIKIAVDAMGGINSPKKIIDAIFSYLKKRNDVFIEIHGNKSELEKYMENLSEIKNNFSIVHCDNVIRDSESPLQAAKQKKNSSMFSAINSVKLKNSHVAVSAGNTGALLVLSRLTLNMMDGIDKPALAGLWPNQNGMNVVLDLGANVDCSEKNLIDFSIMGHALHKALFPNTVSKVTLLNIGTEEIKGNDTLKKANDHLKNISLNKSNFSYLGFIEGNQIMKGTANVIVTDGFSGNIALKTAEGTANFITDELKKTFKKNLLSKIGSFFLYKSLSKFKNKFDPRKYNGAIFLGLNAPIVKSHGSTDSVGFENSLEVCAKVVENNLVEKIQNNLINIAN